MRFYPAVFCWLIAATTSPVELNEGKLENGDGPLQRMRRFAACDDERARVQSATPRQLASRQRKLQRCESVLARKCAKWENLLTGNTISRKRRRNLEAKYPRRCNGSLPYTTTTSTPTACLAPDESCMYYDSSACQSFNYNGTRNATQIGNVCLVWINTDFEAADPGTLESTFGADAYTNYCRDLFNKGKPMCFTEGQNRGGYCFPLCGIESLNCVEPDGSCANYNSPACVYDGYTGNKSVTVSGTPCRSWNTSAALNNYGDSNYCRNPDLRSSPWCTNTDGTEEFCFHNCTGFTLD